MMEWLVLTIQLHCRIPTRLFVSLGFSLLSSSADAAIAIVSAIAAST